MSTEEKRAIAARMLDAFVAGDAVAFRQTATPEFTRVAMEEWRPAAAATWADSHLEVTDAISEGDRLWIQMSATDRQIGEWQSLPASGRTATITAVAFMRFEGDRVAEFGALFDDLARVKQLGGLVVPAATAVTE